MSMDYTECFKEVVRKYSFLDPVVEFIRSVPWESVLQIYIGFRGILNKVQVLLDLGLKTIADISKGFQRVRSRIQSIIHGGH